MDLRILRLKDVLLMTGQGRATIYDWMARGIFPRQIKLGERSVGWFESEIKVWISYRASNRKVEDIKQLIDAMSAARTALA